MDQPAELQPLSAETKLTMGTTADLVTEDVPVEHARKSQWPWTRRFKNATASSPKKDPPKTVPYVQLFRFASFLDLTLTALAFLCSASQGVGYVD